jgi:signal transduction histidine kinase
MAIAAGTDSEPLAIGASHDSTASPSCHTDRVAFAAAPRSAWDVPTVVAALVCVYGAASVAVVADVSDLPLPTTYGSTSAAAAVVDLVVGLALLGCGATAWIVARGKVIGSLTACLGITWLAADWVGWEGGVPLLRSTAMVLAPFLPAILFHLLLAMPAGHLARRLERVAVALCYAVTGIASVGRALFRDPFRDLHCWSNCTDNVFLVDARPDLARQLDGAWLRFVVILGPITALVCFRSLMKATRAARRAMWSVLLPAAFVAIAESVYAIQLIRDPVEDPQKSSFAAAYFVRASALAMLAAGTIWALLRVRRATRAVSRLAEELGDAPSPGSLRTVLSRSLGDETLDVAYWLPGLQQFVDSSGQRIEQRAGPDQSATSIVRRGRVAAVVTHGRSLPVADLEREIGPAARLAVDNERLRAELLAQVAELRASRSRIVETADGTRRRLERDLHDGAQQRLLALSYEVRLALAAARSANDSDTTRLLSEAANEVQLALNDLRALAHGIFPSILHDAGLGPALEALAERSSIVVELDGPTETRSSSGAEMAAYLMVSEAIAAAARRSASEVSARVEYADDHLVVEVHDERQGHGHDSDTLVHVSDRIGALGGHVVVIDNGLRAVIPCA